MPVLMSIAGVRGPGVIAGYAGWFLLNSFTWGGARSVQKQIGRSGRMGAFVVAPQLKPVIIKRDADMMSPQIWQLLLTLTRKRVEFAWLRTGAEGLTPYLQVALSNAFITSAAHEANFGEPEETLTFSYEAVEIRVVNVGNSLSGAQDVVEYTLGTAARV